MPEAVPVLLTFTVSALSAVSAKVAVTLVATVPMVMVQLLPLGDGQLVQPVKVDAEENGVAVSTTVEPLSKLAEQVPLLQLIPAGELLTVPAELPFRTSVALTAYSAGMKFAVMIIGLAPIVTVHVLVPEQPPPLQPAKIEVPRVGVAVRVTVVPW